MAPQNKRQFGIKSLFFLMVVTAFTIVGCQSVETISDDMFVIALVMSGISALVGFAMVVLSVLFATGVAVTDKTPVRSNNLRQCLHLFAMGVVAALPIILMFVVAISNWKLY